MQAALRARTAGAHAEAEAAFSAFDLSQRPSYLAFLRAHAQAVPSLEATLQQQPGITFPWRPRAGLLRRDLADLAGDIPAELCMVWPAAEHRRLRLDEAGCWGLLYVLEGSRLGGRVLMQQVGSGMPKRYLSDWHLPGEWRRFREALQNAAAGQDGLWLERALGGARLAFRRFQQAAQSCALEQEATSRRPALQARRGADSYWG